MTTDPIAAGAGRMIGVDWGTTHVRAWLLERDGTVVEARHDDRGMGRLANDPQGFGAAYDALVDGWPDVAALACGMVGARQGWREAPYVRVPAALDDLPAQAVEVRSPSGRRLRILPGLAQAAPADVMRGEETKLVGLAGKRPDLAEAGTAVLPGTHCKHVDLEHGRVRGFRSVPSGELFDVLRRHSILRLGLEGAEASDPHAFAEAVVEAARWRAGELTAALFGLRARSLLEDTSPDVLRGRLSGMLIGAELALLDPGRPVALVGSGALTEPYGRALEALGRPVAVRLDGDELVRIALARLASSPVRPS
ncbi:MAG: 2-dehydro-3-deoxygalactonokinase [Pseudomonadota bacterium]